MDIGTEISKSKNSANNVLVSLHFIVEIREIRIVNVLPGINETENYNRNEEILEKVSMAEKQLQGKSILFTR